MRIYHTVLLVCVVLGMNAQVTAFTARFKSLQNGEEVLYAKVSNTAGLVKLTNIDGYVTIPVSGDGILVISHLVYDTLIIKTLDFKDKDSLVFYLQPKTYDLREVTFSVLGGRSLFDRKFVSNDLGKSDEQKVREKLRILELKQELIGLDRSAQGGVVLGSPITYLYDRFSKKGKERIEYARLIERDRQLKKAGKKYDNLIVKMLTNYDAEELEKFQKFCAFHPSYIEAVDALELYFEILRCKKEFIEKGI
ncbi:MAG: hypothetical protein ACI9GO_001001 [Bacteroidia bacterium]|jgi:hypothetical protein